MSIGSVDDSQIDWSSPAGDLVVVGDGTHTTRKNNLTGSAAPTGSDSFAMGYSVGSLWQWGQRVWRCYGDGQWDELVLASSDKLVPTGGTTGQALVKASGANNDVEWGDAAAPTYHAAELTHSTDGNLTNTGNTVFNADDSAQWGTECVPNTSTDKITVQSDGVYEIYISGRHNVTTSSVVFGYAYATINGSSAITGDDDKSLWFNRNSGYGATSEFPLTVSFPISLSDGDEIQLVHRVQSTSAYWKRKSMVLRVTKIG